jgi:integrase
MPYRLQAIRRHFSKLGLNWQIRDLRAKAASDSLTSRDAQRLLGHAAASTTDGYIRRRAGEKVTPITRKVK